MTTIADIVGYLREEELGDRLFVTEHAVDGALLLVDLSPGEAGAAGATAVDLERGLEIAQAVELTGVQVDGTAGATDLAWSKRAEAAAPFRGGLLICTPEAAKGADAPIYGIYAPVRRGFVVSPRPRLAMALAVRRFFPELMADRPARFHSVEQREQAEAVGAWVMNAALAERVTLGAHCSIGCSGMGYERREDGSLVGFPQIGSVVIESDVDVAAHATIQRGAIGSTRIRRGAKIGPHVNVGHNVEIGRDVLIVGHAQIGGGASIGAGAVLWQSCAVANGVTVGEGAVIGMGAQVLKDVPPGETWVGNPARPLRKKK